MKLFPILLIVVYISVSVTVGQDQANDTFLFANDDDVFPKYSCCNILYSVQDCKNQLICQLCSFLNDIAQAMSNSIQNYLPNYLYYCITSFFYSVSGQVCGLVPYWYCYNGPWIFAEPAVASSAALH